MEVVHQVQMVASVNLPPESNSQDRQETQF